MSTQARSAVIPKAGITSVPTAVPSGFVVIVPEVSSSSGLGAGQLGPTAVQAELIVTCPVYPPLSSTVKTPTPVAGAPPNAGSIWITALTLQWPRSGLFLLSARAPLTAVPMTSIATNPHVSDLFIVRSLPFDAFSSVHLTHWCAHISH